MPVMTAAAFPSFFAATRAARLTGPEHIINMAQRTNYPFFELVRGRDPFSVCQGGQSIVEVVKASDIGTFGAYNPGDQANTQLIETDVELSYRWRFYRSYINWTEQQFKLHTNGGQFVGVKNYKKSKKSDLITTHTNGFDNLMWAVPSYDRMEAAGGSGGGEDPGQCYSIPAFISEGTGTSNTPPTTVWATDTIGGKDVGDNSWWRNKVETYNTGDLTHPTDGVLAAFDRIFLQLQYKSPPKSEGAFQDVGTSALVIYTNMDGFTKLKQFARAAQDRWENPNDAARPSPKFDGVTVHHCPRLDVENLEENPVGTYTGVPYVTGRPRYFIVNRDSLHPVFAYDGWMDEKAPMTSRDQPDTWTVWCFTTMNLVCNARHRCGIVRPG